MYALYILAMSTAASLVLCSVIYTITLRKKKKWLRNKYAEDIVYKTRELQSYLKQFFGDIRTADIAPARLADHRAKRILHRMVCDLKSQVGINFPELAADYEVILAAISTAHDALQNVVPAGPGDTSFSLEVLDLAVGDLNMSIVEFERGLRSAAGGERIFERLAAEMRPKRSSVAFQTRELAA